MSKLTSQHLDNFTSAYYGFSVLELPGYMYNILHFGMLVNVMLFTYRSVQSSQALFVMSRFKSLLARDIIMQLVLERV